MTQKELKERFSYFGEIEDCTLHFRDHGYEDKLWQLDINYTFLFSIYQGLL